MGATMSIGRGARMTRVAYSLKRWPEKVRDVKQLDGIANKNDFSRESLALLFAQCNAPEGPNTEEVRNFHTAVQTLVNCLKQFQGAHEKALCDAMKAFGSGTVNPSDRSQIQTKVVNCLGGSETTVENIFYRTIYFPIYNIFDQLMRTHSVSMSRLPKQAIQILEVYDVASTIRGLL